MCAFPRWLVDGPLESVQDRPQFLCRQRPLAQARAPFVARLPKHSHHPLAAVRAPSGPPSTPSRCCHRAFVRANVYRIGRMAESSLPGPRAKRGLAVPPRGSRSVEAALCRPSGRTRAPRHCAGPWCCPQARGASVVAERGERLGAASAFSEIWRRVAVNVSAPRADPRPQCCVSSSIVLGAPRPALTGSIGRSREGCPESRALLLRAAVGVAALSLDSGRRRRSKRWRLVRMPRLSRLGFRRLARGRAGVRAGVEDRKVKPTLVYLDVEYGVDVPEGAVARGEPPALLLGAVPLRRR